MDIPQAAHRITGALSFPGDKSIAHRAVLIASLSSGKTAISNFPLNKDCLATVECLRLLGVKIGSRSAAQDETAVLSVEGQGGRSISDPGKPLYIEESGTTFRLLAGVLAGKPLCVTLQAGPQLSLRPMRRIIEPLRRMGAKVEARQDKSGEQYAPLHICGGNLQGGVERMEVASAQVKSAILLAGVQAKGITKITEPLPTRDHTERMLRLFRVPVHCRGNTVSIRGPVRLYSPGEVYVPGDASSAAFFAVAAILVGGSSLVLKRISLNPGRTGFLDVLKKMGADISVFPEDVPAGTEPLGDVRARFSSLKAVKVSAAEVPYLIDELPVLMVAASRAKGVSVFEGVEELRVKETDRIAAMKKNLSAMGVKVEVSSRKGRETLTVEGPARLTGCRVETFNDHRICMSMAVAALAADGKTGIDDAACVRKSFPGFWDMLGKVTR